MGFAAGLGGPESAPFFPLFLEYAYSEARTQSNFLSHGPNESPRRPSSAIAGTKTYFTSRAWAPTRSGTSQRHFLSGLLALALRTKLPFASATSTICCISAGIHGVLAASGSTFSPPQFRLHRLLFSTMATGHAPPPPALRIAARSWSLRRLANAS